MNTPPPTPTRSTQRNIEWNPRPLGSLSSFITKGATPTTYGFRWEKDGVRFLRSECVSEQGLDLGAAEFISPEAHAVLKRGEIAGGDLLMTITGNVGRVVRLAPDFGVANINQHIARIRIRDPAVDPDFVYHWLSQPSIRRHYLKITTGQAYPQISLQQVRSTLVYLPPLPIQRVISVALSDVDALLVALEKLIAKKRAQRHAALQDLLTGKRRLPGFFSNWTTKRVGELFQILGTANNSRADLSTSGDTAYVHYGDIHASTASFLDCGTARLLTIDGSRVSGIALLRDGDLVMADASEDQIGIGKSVEVRNIGGRRVVAGLHTFLLRGDPTQIALGYRAYLQFLPSFRHAMMRLATGISVFGISKSNVRSIEVGLPPVEEQIAITTVLSDMDAEIEALEARLEKTRLLKQGMMQELLTGGTRLS